MAVVAAYSIVAVGRPPAASDLMVRILFTAILASVCGSHPTCSIMGTSDCAAVRQGKTGASSERC